MPRTSLYARAWIALISTAWTCAAAAAGERLQNATQDSTPCAACIVLAATAEQGALVTEPLNGVEILVRVGTGDEHSVLAAVDRIRSHGGRAGLWVPGLAEPSVWARSLALANRVVLDLSAEVSVSDDLAFRLKTYLTDLRSVHDMLRLGIYARTEVLSDLLRRDLGAYVDFDSRASDARPEFPAGLTPAIPTLVWQQPPGGRFVSESGWIVSLPIEPEEARRILIDVARAAPVLVEGLIRGGIAEVRCGARALETFLNPESLDTVAVVRGCPDGQLAIVPETAKSTRVVTSTGDILLNVAAPEGHYAQDVQVVGTRKLSVREIIARHQAAAVRQRRHVRQLISTGRMTLTFEAPGFPAPMAITTDAVMYTAGGVVEIQQRDVRVNGIAFRANRGPRLPLLEPERVASPPLAIALTDVYRYSLDGEDVVDGVRSYVVKFEPLDRKRTLYAGRAWIAADEFAMVKVSAVQTGLRGAIVSSDQSDEFRREADGVWLLARSEVHQIYEGAGHRTPIHRVLMIDRHEINPPAFEERRQAAYASPSIMLRDTAEGFRYLQREHGSGDRGAVITPAIEDAAERVRTVAVGVIIDPNISRPLPFAGLSYVDFDLFGTGTQMNGFFGGTYGQMAVAVPSLGRTRWQLAARAFGIASSYNDRAFVEGREEYRANIAQRPAHASAWLLRPLTARLTARAGYEFDYTAYKRVDSTAASFAVPAAQSAHGLRLAIEGQWSGWSASVWWTGARRAGWREWGAGGGEYDPRHREYQRFGAVASRSFVPSPRIVGRVEASLMGGLDLDRFSRYYFGSFDNRLRGYPSALIRYDRGGVLRSAVAWAAGRRLRLDGFADTAFVRDPGFGARSRTYTGIGTAAEVPAPFGTLVAIEWGYGFQGINTDGRRGTQVVRISGYKMF